MILTVVVVATFKSSAKIGQAYGECRQLHSTCNSQYNYLCARAVIKCRATCLMRDGWLLFTIAECFEAALGVPGMLIFLWSPSHNCAVATM